MPNKTSQIVQVKYPKFRKELLRMVDEDQNELKKQYETLRKMKSEREKARYINETVKRSHKRAIHMLKILDEIKVPTLDNIGEDGAEALIVLTLHSYMGIMKKVLSILEPQFEKYPDSIYKLGIPPIKDRNTSSKCN